MSLLVLGSAQAGTQSLGDLTPGSGDSFPYQVGLSFPGAYLDGKTYFGIRCEWWQTDGVSSDTGKIVDLTSGGTGCGLLNPAAINGAVLFVRHTTEMVNDNVLWCSDGTPAGTTKLTISGFPGSSYGARPWLGKPGYGYIIGTSQTGGQHGEVWSTDSTAAGTVKLASTGTHMPSVTFMPDHRMVIVGDGLWVASSPAVAAVSVPVSFTAATNAVTVGNRIVFVAGQPWGSDLTGGGTQQLTTVPAGSGGVSVVMGPVSGAYAYFTGYDYLYRTDGTAAGTLQLTSTGVIAKPPVSPFASGVILPVQQGDGFHLWRSDGSASGTASISTAALGASNPAIWASTYGSDMLFGASGLSNNLWHSAGQLDDAFTFGSWDGTVQGDHRRFGDADVLSTPTEALVLRTHKPRAISLPYPSSGTIKTHQGLLGGSLHYFAVPSPTTGREPWSMDLSTQDVPACSYPSKSVPDNSAAGRSDSVYFTVLNPVAKLRVYLNLPHTYVGDLSAKLMHVSSGTTVTLLNRPGTPGTANGCPSNDLDVVLDDGASSVVGAGCSTNAASQAYAPGTVLQPVQALSAFRGESLAGEWRLTVSDNAGSDVGGIDSWCLQNVDRLFSDDFQP